MWSNFLVDFLKLLKNSFSVSQICTCSKCRTRAPQYFNTCFDVGKGWLRLVGLSTSSFYPVFMYVSDENYSNNYIFISTYSKASTCSVIAITSLIFLLSTGLLVFSMALVILPFFLNILQISHTCWTGVDSVLS